MAKVLNVGPIRVSKIDDGVYDLRIKGQKIGIAEKGPYGGWEFSRVDDNLCERLPGTSNGLEQGVRRFFGRQHRLI